MVTRYWLNAIYRLYSGQNDINIITNKGTEPIKLYLISTSSAID